MGIHLLFLWNAHGESRRSPTLELAKLICHDVEGEIGAEGIGRTDESSAVKEIIVAMPVTVKGVIFIDQLRLLESDKKEKDLVTRFLNQCLAVNIELREKGVTQIDYNKIEPTKERKKKSILSWHWVKEENFFERLKVRTNLTDVVGPSFAIPAF